MTRNYTEGFFRKCAEHRVPYEVAVAMFKRAADNAEQPSLFSRTVSGLGPDAGSASAIRRAVETALSRRPVGGTTTNSTTSAQPAVQSLAALAARTPDTPSARFITPEVRRALESALRPRFNEAVNPLHRGWR